jgi:hypothetical protein
MSEVEAAPPKLFEHVCRVFAEMRKSSSPINITDGGERRHALVYEGFPTRMFQHLGLPTPYYTSVMRRLQEMGCIRQLSRGGGGSPSRWELTDDPTFDMYAEAEKLKRERPTRLGMVEDNVVALTERLGTLEERFAKLIDGEATG